MVTTVINGEVVLVVQNKIEDARFKELDIIPLGTDKVFIHSVSESDVITIFDGAKEFFKHFFSI